MHERHNLGLVILGITLILGASLFLAVHRAALCMLIPSWFTRLSQRWTAASTSSSALPATGDVANGLLRDAQALSGLDPYEAGVLRTAARAYLSVIR